MRVKFGGELAGGAHLARERPSCPPDKGGSARRRPRLRHAARRAASWENLRHAQRKEDSELRRRIGWSQMSFERARTMYAPRCASALRHLVRGLQHLTARGALEAHKVSEVTRQHPSTARRHAARTTASEWSREGTSLRWAAEAAPLVRST